MSVTLIDGTTARVNRHDVFCVEKTWTGGIVHMKDGTKIEIQEEPIDLVFS